MLHLIGDINGLQYSLGKQRREKNDLADKRQGRTKSANNTWNVAFYPYQIYAKRDKRSSISFGSSDGIRSALVNSKLDMIEGLLPISSIQYDVKLQEAEELL